MKVHFAIKDNILNKKILNYIEEKSFTRKRNVSAYIEKIVKYFSLHFTKGNTDKA